ncbi:MAG TPA: hypothetical protein VFS83_02870 [Ktedonobacterales bacterium]|nr:hypothetical protein [Ktedonobacterales bacterium]
MENQTPTVPHPKLASEATVNRLHQSQKVMVSCSLLFAAALLGASVVLLATLVSLPRLDTSLLWATNAFAVALPCLAVAFSISAYRFFSPEPATTALALTALTADGVGGFAALVGILLILAHLSAVTALIAMLTLFVLMAIFVISSMVLVHGENQRGAPLQQGR